jgi:hypothetical protein
MQMNHFGRSGETETAEAGDANSHDMELLLAKISELQSTRSEDDKLIGMAPLPQDCYIFILGVGVHEYVVPLHVSQCDLRLQQFEYCTWASFCCYIGAVFSEAHEINGYDVCYESLTLHLSSYLILKQSNCEGK